MKRKEQFIVRTVMDHHVLMPYGETANHFSGMILTSEAGAFIWDHIGETSGPEEMADMLVQEFDVSREEALADVTTLFENFRKAGWVE